MSKGSGFTRTVAYFRTADLTEAQACLQACVAVVQEREADSGQPVKRRKRRTKHTDSSPIDSSAASAAGA